MNDNPLEGMPVINKDDICRAEAGIVEGMRRAGYDKVTCGCIISHLCAGYMVTMGYKIDKENAFLYEIIRLACHYRQKSDRIINPH